MEINLIEWIASELYMCYQYFLTVEFDFLGFSTLWDFLITFFIFGEIIYILFGIELDEDDD